MQKQYKRKQTNVYRVKGSQLLYNVYLLSLPPSLVDECHDFQIVLQTQNFTHSLPISVHSKLASFISRQESFLSYKTRLSRRANALLGCCVSLPAAACKSFGTPIHSCQGMGLLLLLQPKHAFHAFSLTTIQVRQLESST